MASAPATDDNPLLTDFYFPPFDLIAASHVRPGIRALLKRLEVELEELEKTVEPTWSKLVEPLEKIVDRLTVVWGAVNHLKSVKDNPELRSAIEEVQPEQVSFALRLGQSKPMYNAFKAIRESPDWHGLSDARKRIVEAQIREAVLSGIALEDDKRVRFNEIEQELTKLSRKFGENVLDATKKFEKLVTDKKEIEGLPATALGLAAQTAVSKVMSLLAFPLFLFMEDHEASEEQVGAGRLVHQHHPTSRQDSAVVGNMLPCDGGEDPTLEKSVELEPFVVVFGGGDNRAIDVALEVEPPNQKKEESALLFMRRFGGGILGSDLAVFGHGEGEKRTAEEEGLSPESCRGRDGAAESGGERERAERERERGDMEDLKDFCKSQGALEAKDLNHWDIGFWSERLRESKYELNEEELRPYFPLPRVMDGLFKLANKLFGIYAEPADGLAQVWDKDVRFYRVNDSSGSPIAYFYFDPYSRPSEKRDGAWMDEVVGRSRVLSVDGASVRLPVAHMVCNQMPPVGEKPSLMTFREVDTVFHEFGHALQHMLTRENEGMVAGIRGIEWDAVELPSQFMENWCYHRYLELLLSLCLTNIYKKLLAARTFRAGSFSLRQLRFATLDLELHSRYTPGGSETIFDVDQRVSKKTQVLPPLPDDKFLCGFSHIFNGGYAAGYYSYKWAEVLSADAFSAFEDVGLENEMAVQETGRRFRETVLARGGGKDPLEVFIEFRGREPSPEPLLRHNGLLPAAA
ncbi:unnamed protein product [Cuscuta campestris]|uniref:oligopeptidase A n=1 Tax=Cuscuta campestris TaxID=132261 RepID=A0A484L1Y7_9ASTE|nr:unnamed protein product [Cuscuta campestris]